MRRHSHCDGRSEYFHELSKLQMLLQGTAESMQQDFIRLHEQLNHLSTEELARLVEDTLRVVLAMHYQADETIQKTHSPDIFPVFDSKEKGANPEADKSGSIDPLSKARQRGQAYVAAEWRRPENLTLMEASERAGRSDRAINEDRRHGRLYALVKNGTTRGQRYPAWQFDVDRGRLGEVLRPFFEAQASCWMIHDFMFRPAVALNGLSPRDIIADKSKPIDRVVEMAKLRLDGEQGAI